MELIQILAEFIDDTQGIEIKRFGEGLIHGSYLVSKKNEPEYILQEFNTSVFKQPSSISYNLNLLSHHLHSIDTIPFFPLSINSKSHHPYVIYEGKYFRLTPYVKDSHSINSCSKPEEAYEASFQFGRFTAAFKDFTPETLKETIPQFHDLAFRWKQFMDALKVGNQKRIQFARKEIDQIQDHYHIVEKFNSIKSTNSFLKRVTHHDTKISNVLFDSSSKGICVIDLDTVMAGFFISDVGDMFRTYLSSANEEEQDLEKVVARKDFYNAILEGYLEIMNDQMTVEERQNFSYAGEFMIYMQALRFITDFINDDVYYGISYEINNYNRTKNQLRLLKEFYSMLN
jgi:thiamine kinase-like enzyme